ncbi:MAG: glycoside hydrolase family 32 protein [Epulopiscium sp.]|nr:glycoside hydrolase family 32 protein [Candidatus Epulonipiscium sp.]
MENTKTKAADQFIKANKSKLNTQYRLNYHLMGEFGWINDPNGFIFYRDKFHLFYQHYPYESVWGPMHWGHATSDDLIQWEYQPIALAPDTEFDKDGCFSGSSLEKDGMLFLIYTGHSYINQDKSKYRQTQGMAYSKDGIHFIKYEGNPILGIDQIPEDASKEDFRDPKVIYAEGFYYMLVGSNDGKDQGQVLLYQSKDLLHWEFVNILIKGDKNTGVNWECPDVFQLQGKDILIVSPQYMKAQGNDYHNLHSSIYFIGELNLKEGIFTSSKYAPIDYGFDFYAPQTAIDHKGRRIMIGWMDMWESEMPTQSRGDHWAGAMTLPREVILKDNKLFLKPIDEIKKYRQNQYILEYLELIGENFLNTTGDCYELNAVFEPKNSEEFGFKLRASKNEETVLSYSVKDKLFKFNRDHSGIGPRGERKTNMDLINNQLSLRIFVDKSSVEIFLNNGEKVMSGRIYPGEDAIHIKAFSKGGSAILSLEKWDIVL